LIRIREIETTTMASNTPSLHAPPSTRAPEASGMSSVRVLVVDDDAQVRHFLASALGAEGFDVGLAASGDEALRLLRERGPWSVVLTDEEMPGLTGRQLLSRLRNEGKDIPAVLFSASLQLSAAEQARLGVGPVLHKPAGSRDVAEALKTALARAA
jgi:CheY-like chemotaxis protein